MDVKVNISDIKLSNRQQQSSQRIHNRIAFDIKVKEQTVLAHLELKKDLSKDQIDILYGLADCNIVGFA